jgi:hypothetical protein
LRQSSSVESPTTVTLTKPKDDYLQVTENELMIFMDNILRDVCLCFGTEGLVTQEDEVRVLQGIRESIESILKQRVVSIPGK